MSEGLTVQEKGSLLLRMVNIAVPYPDAPQVTVRPLSSKADAPVHELIDAHGTAGELEWKGMALVYAHRYSYAVHPCREPRVPSGAGCGERDGGNGRSEIARELRKGNIAPETLSVNDLQKVGPPPTRACAVQMCEADRARARRCSRARCRCPCGKSRCSASAWRRSLAATGRSTSASCTLVDSACLFPCSECDCSGELKLTWRAVRAASKRAISAAKEDDDTKDLLAHHVMVLTGILGSRYGGLDRAFDWIAEGKTITLKLFRHEAGRRCTCDVRMPGTDAQRLLWGASREMVARAKELHAGLNISDAECKLIFDLMEPEPTGVTRQGFADFFGIVIGDGKPGMRVRKSELDERNRKLARWTKLQVRSPLLLRCAMTRAEGGWVPLRSWRDRV